MKLSIITINLNNREGLKKTIDSVVSQTFTDFEWIVIDGGSTDGSRELMEQYESRFSYWVSEPDKGIYNAMNKGVLKANGDYLLFLNSGDYLSSSTVFSQFIELQTEEDYVCGNVEVEVDGEYEILKSPERADFGFFFRSSLPHQASFIRKRLFETYGLYNEENKIVSDWEIGLRSLVMGTAKYKHIELTVCFFDLTGVSSQQEFKVVRDQEQRRFYLSIMPEYVLDELNYYKKEYNASIPKLRLYGEYMTIKNGKMGWIIQIILWVKKQRRRLRQIILK